MARHRAPLALSPVSVATCGSLAWVALGLGACTNPVDTRENIFPPRDSGTVTEVDVPSEVETVEAACDCLAVGQWFRFDTLALTSIDGGKHPVLPTLNELWKSDIAGNELNILFEITALTDTSLTARVVNGARIDGSQDICQLAGTAVTLEFPRSGCELGVSAESAFNVYAGTETYPKNCTTTLPVKHAIPVSRARLSGTFSDTCDAIVGGKVPSGGLGQAELGQICTCLLLPGDPAEKCGALDASFTTAPCVGCNKGYKSLSELLTAFGDVGWTCQTETGTPAACLTADYSAVTLGAAPAECAL